MRALFGPALVVCLAGMCFAGDWDVSIGKGTIAFHRGDWVEALSHFEASWPLAEAPAEKAITANDVATTLHALNRDKEARPWFERSIALWREIPGRSEELAETTLGLVDLYRGTGDFAGGEKTLRELLEVKVTVEEKAAILNTLGDMLREQSRKDEARQRFEAALALDGLTPKRRIESWLGLADLDRSRRDYSSSVEKWNRALELARSSGDTLSEALALRGLGLTWTDTGESAKAEPVLRRSLAIFQQAAHPQPRQVAAAYTCLGRFYSTEAKISLAEEAYLKALALERKHSGNDHPQTAVIMEAVARISAIQKKFGDAHDLANQALKVMTASFGAKSMPAAGALATLALVEQLEKHMDAAAADYALALETMRAEGAGSDQNLVDVMGRYAEVLTQLRRSGEAKEVRNQIKAFRAR